ncbi:hypothetical protein CRT60_01925 [Azospirillum palustre]|uniref:Uncharacterized protein n=2 Tax=Azospirillum palustre TaxID=2044885 RepID=A0A2B8BNH0_9PROT|nr:hypothetical protein CRT60_01925 [Azospirillum palustre]
MGFAASLLFAMPALAGTTGVVVQNLSGQTVTVSGTSIGLPSSINNGASGTGTSSFSSGQPDSGVLTVSGGGKTCSFSWSRPGQQVKNGPLCGTLTAFATPLGVTAQCPTPSVSQQPSPTCTGAIVFTIR